MILITLFTPGLVPLYLVVRNVGLIDSIWSLILPSLTSAWYVAHEGILRQHSGKSGGSRDD